MQIGIITYWSSDDNYGQQLQCYALQRFLRDKKHNAFLIKYKPTAEPGLMRVIIISISSVIIVGFLAYTIGINAHLRAGLKRTIQTRLKRK